jgi:cytochrome c peroxidase
VVGHAGTHEVSVIDRLTLHTRIADLGKKPAVGAVQAVSDLSNELSFLIGLRRRIALPGNGPRGLCIAQGQVVAGMYFSDELAVSPLEAEGGARAIPLGPRVPLSEERQGEMFFNNAQFCFQHWQSCASCHPDGRADGLNWDLLNDGIGNPKNTKSLLVSLQTPPSMSLAIREDAAHAVRSGLRFIQFAIRPEEDAQKIDTYLKLMKPVPSPSLVKGKLSDKASRGQKVFEKAGCITCHSGPYHTDMKQYNVGLGTGAEAAKDFDTPTLLECWRTAPYYHDGRSRSMKDALIRCNKNDAHGTTRGLTPQEQDDLVEYVLSL